MMITAQSQSSSPSCSLRAIPLEIPAVEWTASHAIIETLIDIGISEVYGIPGGAISAVFDATAEFPEFRPVITRHETSAVFMAMGQWRTTQRPAAVFVTSGPGVTNCLTGLATAFENQIPVLILAGEAATRLQGRGALQDGSAGALDILGVVGSLCKRAYRIDSPDDAADIVAQAMREAVSGRPGPVLVTLPIDIARQPCPPSTESDRAIVRMMQVQAESPIDQVDELVLEEVARQLDPSRRGLIVLGSGASNPSLRASLIELAERTGYPVATSPKGKGSFPEDHRLALGVLGNAQHPSAVEYLSEGVEVTLLIGTGLRETSTNGWTLAFEGSECTIRVDIDATHIERNCRVDHALVASAESLVPRLVRCLGTQTAPERQWGVRRAPLANPSLSAGLDPVAVLDRVQSLAPADAVWASDIGEHLLFSIHQLEIPAGGQFLADTGFGSMGSGIGAAIGASVAQPRRQVICVCGDYGFQMFGMELATCVQEGLDIVFVVFNDGGMRMVENGFERVYGRCPDLEAPRLDIAAIARSVGAVGHTIASAADLDALSELAVPGRPTVLDFRIDPAAAFPAIARDDAMGSFEPKAKASA